MDDVCGAVRANQVLENKFMVGIVATCLGKKSAGHTMIDQLESLGKPVVMKVPSSGHSTQA
jgi:hypothetical protein